MGEDEIGVSIYDYDRIPLIAGLLILFFLALSLIGGIQGIKAFAGLVYTILCVFGILIPMTLKGVHAIPLTCVITLVTGIVCFYLIGGISQKTIAAALGAVMGISMSIASAVYEVHEADHTLSFVKRRFFS